MTGFEKRTSNSAGGTPQLAAARFYFILPLAAFVLSSCGFHLRGQAALPFETIYVQAAPASQFAMRFKRTLSASSGARVVDNAKEAQVTLHVLGEQQEKQILTLSGGGRVREYELRYRVSYRLTGPKNQEYTPISEIVLRQDVTYNDNAVLSKESEEALLYRDMRNDAVQQLIRRLQAAKVKS